MAHHFFALAVSGLLIAYLGNDRSVLHFRYVAWSQVFTRLLTWQIAFHSIEGSFPLLMQSNGQEDILGHIERCIELVARFRPEKY